MSIDARKFADHVSIVTVIANRRLNENEIETLAYSFERNGAVSGDVTVMFDAMLTGRKIDAIKEHRIITKMGLKESKDEIERVMFRFKQE